MRSTLATLAFVGLSVAVPQGVTSAITPQSSSPTGCLDTYPGAFQIAIIDTPSTKRDVNGGNTPLVITLNNGILKDTEGRTGYIAANNQFQFDGPPQTGAIYTAGFSICPNASLALGGTAIWYKCLSGNFYNLYNADWADQCSPIYIHAVNDAAAPAPTAENKLMGVDASSAAVENSDGQITATSLPSLPVYQSADGQPEVPTSAPPRPTTPAAPVTTSAPACNQYGDGQPQCQSTIPVPTSTVPTPPSNSSWTPPPKYSGTPIPPAMGMAASLGLQHVVFNLVFGALAVVVLC